MALAASSGTKTASVVSLCELVDSRGAIEVAGAKQTGKVRDSSVQKYIKHIKQGLQLFEF